MYHTYTVGLGLIPFTVGCRSGVASHENYEGITPSKRSNASSPDMLAIAFGQLTQLAIRQPSCALAVTKKTYFQVQLCSIPNLPRTAEN